MNRLNLTPNSKPILNFYRSIEEKRQLQFWREGNVAPAFGNLLEYCAKTTGYVFNQQHPYKVHNKTLWFDGAILTPYKIRYGIWEAKDSDDSLDKEAKKKFASGYPDDNILFQSPDQAILYQDGTKGASANLSKTRELIDILDAFFAYEKPIYEEWNRAADEFKIHVPEIARKLDELIDIEYRKHGAYTHAFDEFHNVCRISINPNLNKDAVEEMLIQHILTERIFTRVFDNDKFTSQNIIAIEIEKVVNALTSSSWNRRDFLRELDRFYSAIESTATTIRNYGEKQEFLNTVYERFFQGFSVAIADTHGIVYTPQPIVQFMVRSVEQLLNTEFGRSLADEEVHILDPFVGTGNFILRAIEEIKSINALALPRKYRYELHCNEIMLLPYYIASMNIEHAYYEATGNYAPFEGICLVDTFELAESRQMGLFTEENLERVERQRQAPLTVIIGNPPYNAWQTNENDNNKNRTYKVLDGRVAETYSRASTATNKNALSDPYVKAFRWASDRIGDEGVIGFVTNNSFIDSIAFDGMRKHLMGEFDAVYVLDLGGNVRKNPKLSGTTHNVFGIQVGVCITFLIRRKSDDKTRNGQLYYARMDEGWRKTQKYDELERWGRWNGVDWRKMIPSSKYLWLTDGMEEDYATFMPIGTQEAKKGKGQAIFGIYGRGLETARDSWVYNFNLPNLQENITRFIETYNTEVDRWNNRVKRNVSLDDFVVSDEKRIKWSSRLKEGLEQGKKAVYDEAHFRVSLYRPFQKSYVYFDDVLNHRQGQFQQTFPTPATEVENRVIVMSDIGFRSPQFSVLMTNVIPDLHLNASVDGHQCFPLYVYNADGTNRRDNISDWALGEYQRQYSSNTITKDHLFYAIYAMLHHPIYREKYAQNLKHELPRIPFIKEGIEALAQLGYELADLHIHYELAPEYPLHMVQNPKVHPSLQVESMRLNRDKTALFVNDFMILEGIPLDVYKYKLGNRSALEWVIDQYRITVDKRSGIINDPNHTDDDGYIVSLVKRVVYVSLETSRIVDEIAKFEF